MTLYSVSLRMHIGRSDVRETVNAIREDLFSAYAPVDVGGSYRDGQFDIWATISAPDEKAAMDIAERAVVTAASRVGTDTALTLPLAVQADLYEHPKWLSVSAVDAKPVLLTPDGLELVVTSSGAPG